MQSWTSAGRNCLSCSLRPLFGRVSRSFTTTSALQRSKPKKSKSSPKKQPSHSSPVFTGVSIRQDVTAQKFTRTVETALQDLADEYAATGSPVKGIERTEKYVLAAARMDNSPGKSTGGPIGQLRATLQNAYVNSGMDGLKEELEYLFRADQFTTQYSTPNLEQQKKVTDLRYPAEWYPQARSMQRTIHLHVGPTNSGKTYHALKRLEKSGHGFYAGPLRLLAQEVFQRFRGTGVPCSLVTGDDVQLPEGQRPRIVSNTVEMVNLGQPFEVGVIDEIQMIADPNRGWAWTRAVLGSRVTELHLCGEPRAVPLIREIAALTGDKLEVHNYQRLSPLEVMDNSLGGNLKKLQKGDCVVSFSRVGIHALKSDIEKTTGRRAAIVYGSLPAEIRTQQASLFNEPDNDYDFLVASDAIGMGLNLSVKRIIFETLVKRTRSEGLVRLGTPEIKQIAGRAGRYRTASQPKADQEANTGLVTSFESVDLPYIKKAMIEEPPPLTTAGIIPPDGVFHKFAAYFPPDVPFYYVLKRLMEIATVSPLFFLCEGSSQLQGTMLLDPVQGLSTEDRLTLMAAPINTSNIQSCNIAESFAQCVAGNTGGRFLDIDSLPLKVLEEIVSGKKEYLQQLETLHRAVILYLWLSYRFGGIFTDRALATHVKELAEERMVRALTEFSANKQLRRDASLHRQIALQKHVQEHEKLLAEADMTSGTSESQDEGEWGSQSEGRQGSSVDSAAGGFPDEAKPRLKAEGTA